MVNQQFDCMIDQNRFVFTSYYYEGCSGFNIYDFEKDMVVFTYDSATEVLGVLNNKIYFIHLEYGCPWDGQIFVCDADTFETSLYMNCHLEDTIYDENICMSPDGKYIAYSQSKKTSNAPRRTIITVIETSTKESIDNYDVGNIVSEFFADKNTLAVSNWNGELILIDI